MFVAAAPARSRGAGVLVGVIVAVFLVMTVFGGAAFFVFRSRSGPTTTPVAAAPEGAYGGDAAWSDLDAAVPVSSRDPSWGARSAPVTLVVFADFECPFCARYTAAIAGAKETYGPGTLRVVWKHYPLSFHKQARPAAIAAESVFRLGGSKAFWSFHDAAFANQKELTQGNFERWAAAAGVDVQRFRDMQLDPAVAAKVDADAALAQSVGVKGTPATFVNGFLVSGAQPPEKLASVIEAEKSAAEQAIAAGTPADRVYVRLSLQNKARNAANTAKSEKAAEPEDEDKVWEVPAGGSPSRGPATAKVTIVMFSDFQCPFCRRVEPTLDDLRRIYGNKIRVVWKNNPLPFHNHAAGAAELALEARAQKGDAGFWAAHDLLFKNQTALSAEDLEGYAAALQLDVARVRTALSTERHKALIAEDQRLAAQLGAKGTPTFFINGHKLLGAQPIERFKALIDAELAR